MPLTLLDRPEVLRAIFYPRPEYASSAQVAGARALSIQVEPGISVGARLFVADRTAPAILYWHGNGELAADYDGLSALYTDSGITLLVVDYRGYGSSDGTPTCANLLSDAVQVYHAVGQVWQEHDLFPSRLCLMGRSLGSAAAIEVAARFGEDLDGLIVESGFADTFALLSRLGIRIQGANESRDGFNNAAKMERVTIPTLIIHGQEDVLIPAQDGQELFRRCAAEDKHLVLSPGAGHNDLLLVGRELYMDSIIAFVFGESGGPTR
ncbi:MAG TPA: alpha/beta hydrolase [Chloroflexi bacterium]|nr:alpha/beta hydrolase [Chloroflexota bacterium]